MMTSPKAIKLWVPRWDGKDDHKTTSAHDRTTGRSEEITKYGYLAKRKRPSPCLPTHQGSKKATQTKTNKNTSDNRFSRPDYGSQFGSWMRDVWHTHFFMVSGPYATYYDKPPFLDISSSEDIHFNKIVENNTNTGLPIACIDLRTVELDLQHGDTIVLRSVISGDGLVLRADGIEEAQDWVDAFSLGGAKLHSSQIQQRPTSADNLSSDHRLKSKQRAYVETKLERERRKSLDPKVARRRNERKPEITSTQSTVSHSIPSQLVATQRTSTAAEQPTPTTSETVEPQPQKPYRLGRRMSLPRALADVRRANTYLHALEAEHGGERLRLRSGSISVTSTQQDETQPEKSERPKDMRGLRTSSLRSRNVMSLPLSGLRGRSPVSPINDDVNKVADVSVCKVVPRSQAVNIAKQFGALVVFSFNILAQSFVDNPRLANIYEHCDGQWLQWKHRVSLIIHHIAEVLPDVLCLQEVDYDAYHDELAPELDKMGYAGLLQTKEKKNGAYIAGNATFWKVDQVELVWSEHKYRALVCGFQMVSKSDISKQQPSSGKEPRNAMRNSTAHRLADQLKTRLPSFTSSSSSSSLTSNDKGTENVHETALMQPKFALANVHLEGSPWKHKDRVSQLRSAEKSFVTRKSNCRIICGDFNAGADNVLCRILEMSGYVSAYPTAHKDATCLLMPHDPMAFNQAASCVDHIYLAGEPLKLHAVTSVFEQGWKRDTMVRSGLPQKLWPSDHLSIGALISFDATSASNNSQPQTAIFHDLSSVVERAEKKRGKGWGGGTNANYGKMDLKQALDESMLSENERVEWLELSGTDVHTHGNLVPKCETHVGAAKTEKKNVNASTDTSSLVKEKKNVNASKDTSSLEKEKKAMRKEKKRKREQMKKTPEQIRALQEWSVRKQKFIEGLNLDKREFVKWYIKAKRNIEKESKDTKGARKM